jgi:hypothetical protein
MDYVLLRYRQRPEDIIGVVSTGNAREAVSLARRWAREDSDLGVIVTVAGRPFVHCTPRRH